MGSRKISDKFWGDHLVCEPVALKSDLCKNLEVRKVRLVAPRPDAQRIRLYTNIIAAAEFSRNCADIGILGPAALQGKQSRMKSIDRAGLMQQSQDRLLRTVVSPGKLCQHLRRVSPYGFG